MSTSVAPGDVNGNDNDEEKEIQFTSALNAFNYLQMIISYLQYSLRRQRQSDWRRWSECRRGRSYSVAWRLYRSGRTVTPTCSETCCGSLDDGLCRCRCCRCLCSSSLGSTWRSPSFFAFDWRKTLTSRLTQTEVGQWGRRKRGGKAREGNRDRQ